MTKPKLLISNLSERHHCISKARENSLYEAAQICLDRHHRSPVDFTIDDTGERLQVSAEWEEPNERARAAWANRNEATENGACACVLAAVEITSGMFAVYRGV